MLTNLDTKPDTVVSFGKDQAAWRQARGLEPLPPKTLQALKNRAAAVVRLGPQTQIETSEPDGVRKINIATKRGRDITGQILVNEGKGGVVIEGLGKVFAPIIALPPEDDPRIVVQKIKGGKRSKKPVVYMGDRQKFLDAVDGSKVDKEELNRVLDVAQPLEAFVGAPTDGSLPEWVTGMQNNTVLYYDLTKNPTLGPAIQHAIDCGLDVYGSSFNPSSTSTRGGKKEIVFPDGAISYTQELLQREGEQPPLVIAMNFPQEYQVYDENEAGIFDAHLPPQQLPDRLGIEERGSNDILLLRKGPGGTTRYEEFRRGPIGPGLFENLLDLAPGTIVRAKDPKRKYPECERTPEEIRLFAREFKTALKNYGPKAANRVGRIYMHLKTLGFDQRLDKLEQAIKARP